MCFALFRDDATCWSVLRSGCESANTACGVGVVLLESMLLAHVSLAVLLCFEQVRRNGGLTPAASGNHSGNAHSR
jgi:hypothetical protein